MEGLEANLAQPVPAGDDGGTSEHEGGAGPEIDETTVNAFTHDPENKHKGQHNDVFSDHGDNGSVLGTLLVFF